MMGRRSGNPVFSINSGSMNAFRRTICSRINRFVTPALADIRERLVPPTDNVPPLMAELDARDRGNAHFAAVCGASEDS